MHAKQDTDMSGVCKLFGTYKCELIKADKEPSLEVTFTIEHLLFLDAEASLRYGSKHYENGIMVLTPSSYRNVPIMFSYMKDYVDDPIVFYDKSLRDISMSNQTNILPFDIYTHTEEFQCSIVSLRGSLRSTKNTWDNDYFYILEISFLERKYFLPNAIRFIILTELPLKINPRCNDTHQKISHISIFHCKNISSYCQGNYYGFGNVCEVCPIGSISANGSKDLFDCVYNYKASNCKEGYYGIDHCKLCPPGLTSNSLQSVKLEVCLKPRFMNCRVGFYGGNDNCTKCPNSDSSRILLAAKKEDCHCIKDDNCTSSNTSVTVRSFEKDGNGSHSKSASEKNLEKPSSASIIVMICVIGIGSIIAIVVIVNLSCHRRAQAVKPESETTYIQN